MADTIQSLDQLSSLKPEAPEAPKYEQKLDSFGRAYATGKRKDAVARVWIKPGTGKITINKKVADTYFARPVLRMLIQQPLVAANRNGQYDVECTVTGGGLSGQAGAVRHGISKALTQYEPDLRGILKRGGFLTRDSRVVERKNTVEPKHVARSSSPSADCCSDMLSQTPADGPAFWFLSACAADKPANANITSYSPNAASDEMAERAGMIEQDEVLLSA